MQEVFDWIRSWGCCDWTGFLIVLLAIVSIVRSGFRPHGVQREEHIYCPKCGYHAAKKITLLKPLDDDKKEEE